MKQPSNSNKMIRRWAIGIGMGVSLGILFSTSAFAVVQVQVISKVAGPRFNLGVGSKVKINFGGSRAAAEGLFLGRVVESNGRSDEYMILDLQKTRAYLMDRKNTQISPSPGKTQAILRGLNQWGPTCGAFALTHYWQQYYLSSLRGNENLNAMMSSERERTKFLEENISHYYLSRSIDIHSLMKQHGKKFGVSCKKYNFTSGSVAADFLYRQTKAGIPVLVDFNIGPNMLTSTYETVDFEKPGTIDSRLWIPRKKGENNAGGHAIVAAAAFESKGNRKVVIIDSDWDQPRIWDVDRYLSDRIAAKEMGFTVCGGVSTATTPAIK